MERWKPCEHFHSRSSTVLSGVCRVGGIFRIQSTSTRPVLEVRPNECHIRVPAGLKHRKPMGLVIPFWGF